MSSQALTLSDRDFDAYKPEKATSKAFSLPRLELKQRALAWARGVVTRIGALGVALEVYASDEHPSLRNKKRVDCQWVFFERDQAAHDELDRLLDRGRRIADVIDDPSPYTRHAFLALRIDDHGVEVAFAVHPGAEVDVDNLRARLDDDARAAELAAAINALPRELTLGVDRALARPELDRVIATEVTPAQIRATLAQAAAEGAEGAPLWIGWWVDRSVAISHSAIMSEQLADALVALAPIYKLVAWSRDNDLIALDKRFERAEEDRRRAHAEAEAEVTRWRAEQEASRRPQDEPKGRAISLASLFRPSSRWGDLKSTTGGPQRSEGHDTSHGGGSAPPRAAEPPPHVAAEPIDVGRSIKPAPKRHPLDPRGPERSSAPAVIEQGVKVRVLKGPFADKTGTVSELDGKGGARVMLGLLSTRFDLADLEVVVEGRDRPSIQSSHRRPPAKPRG